MSKQVQCAKCEVRSAKSETQNIDEWKLTRVILQNLQSEGTRRGWMILHSTSFFHPMETRRRNVLKISINTRTYTASIRLLGNSLSHMADWTILVFGLRHYIHAHFCMLSRVYIVWENVWITQIDGFCNTMSTSIYACCKLRVSIYTHHIFQLIVISFVRSIHASKYTRHHSLWQ